MSAPSFGALKNAREMAPLIPRAEAPRLPTEQIVKGEAPKNLEGARERALVLRQERLQIGGIDGKSGEIANIRKTVLEGEQAQRELTEVLRELDSPGLVAELKSLDAEMISIKTELAILEQQHLILGQQIAEIDAEVLREQRALETMPDLTKEAVLLPPPIPEQVRKASMAKYEAQQKARMATSVEAKAEPAPTVPLEAPQSTVAKDVPIAAPEVTTTPVVEPESITAPTASVKEAVDVQAAHEQPEASVQSTVAEARSAEIAGAEVVTMPQTEAAPVEAPTAPKRRPLNIRPRTKVVRTPVVEAAPVEPAPQESVAAPADAESVPGEPAAEVEAVMAPAEPEDVPVAEETPEEPKPKAEPKVEGLAEAEGFLVGDKGERQKMLTSVEGMHTEFMQRVQPAFMGMEDASKRLLSGVRTWSAEGDITMRVLQDALTNIANEGSSFGRMSQVLQTDFAAVQQACLSGEPKDVSARIAQFEGLQQRLEFAQSRMQELTKRLADVQNVRNVAASKERRSVALDRTLADFDDAIPRANKGLEVIRDSSDPIAARLAKRDNTDYRQQYEKAFNVVAGARANGAASEVPETPLEVEFTIPSPSSGSGLEISTDTEQMYADLHQEEGKEGEVSEEDRDEAESRLRQYRDLKEERHMEVVRLKRDLENMREEVYRGLGSLRELGDDAEAGGSRQYWPWGGRGSRTAGQVIEARDAMPRVMMAMEEVEAALQGVIPLEEPRSEEDAGQEQAKYMALQDALLILDRSMQSVNDALEQDALNPSFGYNMMHKLQEAGIDPSPELEYHVRTIREACAGTQEQMQGFHRRANDMFEPLSYHRNKEILDAQAVVDKAKQAEQEKAVPRMPI